MTSITFSINDVTFHGINEWRWENKLAGIRFKFNKGVKGKGTEKYWAQNNQMSLFEGGGGLGNSAIVFTNRGENF